MLYYVVKFLKLCLRKPRDYLKHGTRVWKEWQDDRITQRLNDIVFVSTKSSQSCFGPQLETFIINESNEHVDRIISFLDKAQYAIDIAIYAMSSDPIGQSLRKANDRGVRVRLICEKNFVRLNTKYADCMLMRKIPPTAPPQRGEIMMHHKFCIIDGQRIVRQLMPAGGGLKPPLTICLTGSLNWVSHTKSCDDMLVTSNLKVANRLEQEFERIWQSISIANRRV